MNQLIRNGRRKPKLTEWARSARPSPDLCGRIHCNDFGESYDHSDQEFDADDSHGGLAQFFTSDSSPASLPRPTSLAKTQLGQEKANRSHQIRKRSLRMGSNAQAGAASSSPPVVAAPFRAPDWCFDIDAKIPSDHVPSRRVASAYVPTKLVDDEASDGNEEDHNDEEADDDEDSSVDSDHGRFVDEKIIHGVLGKKTPPQSKKRARAPEDSYESIPPWALDFHRPSPLASRKKPKYVDVQSDSPSPPAAKKKRRHN
jgi:hypothetical protein